MRRAHLGVLPFDDGIGAGLRTYFGESLAFFGAAVMEALILCCYVTVRGLQIPAILWWLVSAVALVGATLGATLALYTTALYTAGAPPRVSYRRIRIGVTSGSRQGEKHSKRRNRLIPLFAGIAVIAVILALSQFRYVRSAQPQTQGGHKGKDAGSRRSGACGLA